jgi:hypothetical protein
LIWADLRETAAYPMFVDSDGAWTGAIDRRLSLRIGAKRGAFFLSQSRCASGRAPRAGAASPLTRPKAEGRANEAGLGRNASLMA